MAHKNRDLVEIITDIELGSDIAEEDALLENTRVETSVFSDLLKDRVDLIPGTKGSGKSALYRIFVEFLPSVLLHQKKVVIAHGVYHHGDPVFHVFKDKFEQLSEDDFVNFWCIYFVSLAHEHFIKNQNFTEYLDDSDKEIEDFRKACTTARIPEIKGKKSLRDVLGWVLNALKTMNPKLKYNTPDIGEFELDLFGDPVAKTQNDDEASKEVLPLYVSDIKDSLEKILRKSGLNLWLMIDRLDEIFPRRSDLEKRALRALLRTVRFFASPEIRIKIFLRDDILSNIVKTKEGFTALTHVTSRQSDTLKWDESQIRDLLLRRLLQSEKLRKYLDVDMEKFDASADYRNEIFYMIFPETVYKGKRQSKTMRWIYTHVADGNGVVTPRDVIYLVTKAKQREQQLLMTDLESESDSCISSQALLYGHEELSKHKRTTFLEAEFPHLLGDIKKLIGGKTEYNESSLRKIFGKSWEFTVANLVSIGVLEKRKNVYRVPFVYRKGLEVTQGKS